MLSLSNSPSLYPSLGWSLEDIIVNEHHINYTSTTIRTESFDSQPEYSPASQQQLNRCDSINLGANPTPTVKKLSHNANERDRRKKISSLYTSLRSLLPASDHTKKLSIPATIANVLKYIPELQTELEKLNQKKKELSSLIIARNEEQTHHKKGGGSINNGSCLTSVSANTLGKNEVLVQLSTTKLYHKSLVSSVLRKLEEDGFHLLNASSFESSGDKYIYSLHLQVHGNLPYELERLPQILLNYCAIN